MGVANALGRVALTMMTAALLAACGDKKVVNLYTALGGGWEPAAAAPNATLQ